MPDDLVPLDYQCPVCGEKAVAGSHFCGKAATKKTAVFRHPKAGWFPARALPLMGVVTATVLWWPVIGPWSLLFLLLIAGILLPWEKRGP